MTTSVLQCPLCSQPFRVLPEQVGQPVQCPTCGQAVLVPTQQSDPTDIGTEADDAQPEVFPCPVCGKNFGVTVEMHGQLVGCPHCRQNIEIDSLRSQQSRLPFEHPRVEIQIRDNPQPPHADPPVASKTTSRPSEMDSGDPALPQTTPTRSDPSDLGSDDVTHLLPPTFNVFDPDDFSIVKSRQGDHQVLLPDGRGGFQTVDDRVVRMKQGDQEIQLIALSPAQLRRRRALQNTLWMVGGAILLAIIFAILRKTV